MELKHRYSNYNRPERHLKSSDDFVHFINLNPSSYLYSYTDRLSKIKIRHPKHLNI